MIGMRLVRAWKEKVYGLDIFATFQLFNFQLPNLETLNILKDFDGKKKINSNSLVDLISAHKKSLKRFKIDTYGATFELEGCEVPKLDLMTLQGPIKPLLNLAMHVTKLNLEVEVTYGVSNENLKFPNLKHISTGSNDNFRIISQNADHLEVLILSISRSRLEEDLNAMPSLPKLKSLGVKQVSSSPKILNMLLSSSSQSLQHLVIQGPTSVTYEMPRVVQFCKLRSFVTDNLAEWSKLILHKNADIIKVLVINSGEHMCKHFDFTMSSLEKLVFLDCHPSEIKNVRRGYPNLKVSAARESFGVYVKKFLKQSQVEPEMITLFD